MNQTFFYGKSQAICEKIIETFKTGNVPSAIATVFVNRIDNIPLRSWSFQNQFITALNGTNDARGFRQWQNAGRKVKRGSKAFHILGPVKKTVKEKNKQGKKEEKVLIVGFKSIPVFSLTNTEIIDEEKWEKCSGVDTAEEQRLSELPFRDVADSWDLNVNSYNGQKGKPLGYYSYNAKNEKDASVSVGVKNLSTWAHELIHAADHKLKTLTVSHGQQADNADNEIVAELGGAALLEIAGEKTESDIGGAWEYILNYSKNNKGIALKNCMKYINRICQCVDLVLDTATNIRTAETANAA